MAKVFFLLQQLKHAIKRKTVVFSLATVLLHVLFFESAIWKDWSPQATPRSTPSIQVNLRPTIPATNEIDQTTTKTIRAPLAKSVSSVPKAIPQKSRSIPSHKIKEIIPEPLVTQDIKPEDILPETIATIEEKNAASNPIDDNNASKLVVRIPSSIEMRLDVSHTKVNATPTKGVATLSWQVYNNRYSLKLEVGVNLLVTTFNLYTLSSEGDIGPFGLMPGTSTDERKTKAATAIHFNHFEKTITFSASNKTVPMQEGAQDAASLLLQLAAIGNGNPAQFAPGREFKVQVAEGRNANEFLFQVIDEEEIESKLVPVNSKLKTIHIVRPPRPGAYNSKLDIWLAPSLNWYPVQIRNTESNGTVTNQIVTEFKNRVVDDNK
nr:DUF3108 domain-containing protein [uncultured Undibacterium sp.]